MTLQTLLAQTPIFSHLSQAEQGHLAQMAISRTYPKGQWITHYGDNWPYLFIVESGAVNAVKESSEGRSLIVLSLRPGDLLWGLSFFDEHMPMPVALVAEQESALHLWSRHNLLPLILANGRLAWEMARFVILRVQHASDIVEELAFQPVTGRLARLILERYGDAVDGYTARDLTLDEIAARIGTTREMVCRHLSRFAEQGAIQISRTEFKIGDPELLENLARKVK